MSTMSEQPSSSDAHSSTASSSTSWVPPPTHDCPILIWNLSLNREYTEEEYTACYDVVKECVPHVNIPYEPTNTDTFRQTITQMLPLLMMRHRRIPRSKWQDMVTTNGKHWIEQSPDDMPPEKFIYSMIGYHLEYENSLCALAMTQGIQRKVVNIGLGIKQLVVEPRGISIPTYFESLSHKLTHREIALIGENPQDEILLLNRLTITLAMKQSYFKAIGQPLGFDYSRLDFDIKGQRAFVDEHPLSGWEFRIYKVSLGVARGDVLVHEHYLCVSAFFRGHSDTRFIWYESPKELESWVQFINIDQMLKVIPKLTA